MVSLGGVLEVYPKVNKCSVKVVFENIAMEWLNRR